MKAHAFGLLFLLSLTAPASPAFAGMDLAWNACGSSGGDSTVVFDCGNRDSVAVLYGCFAAPDSLPNLVSLDITIDFQIESDELPGFWRFDPTGCNRTGLSISAAMPTASCAGALNPWGEEGSEGLAAIAAYGPQFAGDKNRGRLICVVARSALSPIRIEQGATYFGFQLRFFMDNAKEAKGRCVGCAAPVLISWTKAVLGQVGGKPGEPVPVGASREHGSTELVMTGAGSPSSCVRINRARGRCAFAPTRARTWDTLRHLGR